MWFPILYWRSLSCVVLNRCVHVVDRLGTRRPVIGRLGVVGPVAGRRVDDTLLRLVVRRLLVHRLHVCAWSS